MAPPKGKADTSSADALIELFKSLGLTQSKAAEAAKNAKSAAILKSLVEDPTYGISNKTLDEKQAVLVSTLASQLAKTDLGTSERIYAVNAILSGRLKSTDQVVGACIAAQIFFIMC
jgi:glutaminyl-tRNA synthetase